MCAFCKCYIFTHKSHAKFHWHKMQLNDFPGNGSDRYCRFVDSTEKKNYLYFSHDSLICEMRCLFGTLHIEELVLHFGICPVNKSKCKTDSRIACGVRQYVIFICECMHYWVHCIKCHWFSRAQNCTILTKINRKYCENCAICQNSNQFAEKKINLLHRKFYGANCIEPEFVNVKNKNFTPKNSNEKEK